MNEDPNKGLDAQTSHKYSPTQGHTSRETRKNICNSKVTGKRSRHAKTSKKQFALYQVAHQCGHSQAPCQN